MRLHFLPEFGEDEILFSILAEVYERMSLPNWKRFSMRIYGKKKSLINIEWPRYIDDIVSRFPIGHSYTMDSILDNHTLLPLYRAFTSQSNYKKIREVMSTNDASKTFVIIGINKKLNHLLSSLKFCEKCIEEDVDYIGRAFWHRSHQIPGVLVCHKHNAWLKNSQVMIRNRPPHMRLISLRKAKDNYVEADESILSPYKTYLLNIASDAHWLLKNPYNDVFIEEIKELIKSVLADRGFITNNGKLRNSIFFQAIQEFYPIGFFEHINLPLNLNLRVPWPLKLFRADFILHPIHYLVIIQFLGLSISDLFNYRVNTNYFGNGPWPCLNPTCPHYHQLIITKCQIVTTNHGLQGTFACSCGYIYQRFGEDADPSDIYRADKVVEYGSLWEAEFTALIDNPDMTNAKISKKMGIGMKGLQRKIRDLQLLSKIGLNYQDAVSTYLPVYEEKRINSDEYCRVWMAVIQAFPEKSMDELCSDLKFKRIHKWLLSHEKEWIKSHQPMITNSKKIDFQLLYREINWILKDSYYANQAYLNARELLREQHSECIKVTKKGILSPMGKIVLVPGEIPYMPLTHAVLEAGAEPFFSFFIRRLEWLVQHNVCATNSELKKLSGFHRYQRQIGKEKIESIFQVVTESDQESHSQIHHLLPTTPKDWTEYDKDLSKQVARTVHLIKDLDGYPIKLTIASFGHHMNCLEQLIFHLEMLPQTEEAILNEIETEQAYLERIFEWAEKYFTKIQRCPKFKIFYSVLGLSQFTDQPYVEKAARNLIGKINENIAVAFLEKFPLDDIDKSFSDQIQKAGKSLRDSRDRPKRITASQIRFYLEINATHLFPYWEVFIKYQTYLPLTTVSLSEEMETEDEFIERRLQWAGNEFLKKEICPSISQLIRLAEVEQYMKKASTKCCVEEIILSLKDYPTIAKKGQQSYWEERDAFLVDFINSIAEELRAQTEPCLHISKRRILLRLKDETGIDVMTRLDKVPLTQKAIFQEIDTQESYYHRKILATTERYQKKSICPTFTEFKEAAGITKIYKYDWCKEYVQDAMGTLSEYPRVNRPKKKRKDWNKFDSDTAVKVQQVIDLILKDEPQTRISYSEIERRIHYEGISRRIRQGKMSKTEKILGQYLESFEDFAWRRLQHAIEKFTTQDRCPERMELIEAANVRKYAKIPKFDEAITNACASQTE